MVPQDRLLTASARRWAIDTLSRPPAQLHDPLVQVVRDVQLSGLELSVLTKRQVQPSGHLDSLEAPSVPGHAAGAER